MALFQVVDKFSHALIKAVLKFENVKTDNKVFRLYYKLSTWLVIIYSIFYLQIQVKNPMSCMNGLPDKKFSMGKYLKEITDYCWSQGTYVIMNLDPGRTLEISPGVGGKTGPHDEIFYQDYYKWIYYYMAFMIIVLLTPRHIWCVIENRQMAAIVKKTKGPLLIEKTEEIEKERNQLVEFLIAHFGYHRRYAFGFIFCEILNVAASLMLMLMWDWISNHEFSRNGTNLAFLNGNNRNRTDRQAKIFSIASKCSFKRYGGGGNIENHDFICLMPINVITEPFAVFFWYYFMALVVIGGLAVIFRILLIVSKRLRIYLLSGVAFLMDPQDIRKLVDCCSYSDWFVLYQLGQNVEPTVYREILQKLGIKLEHRV